MANEAEGAPTRPEVLYHYTDAGGFAGILQYGKLWATDVRFLNDPLELKYAWDHLLVTLEARKTDKPEYSEAYDAVLQAISSTKATDPDAIEDRIFSTSFSEDGDELNQWHRYADEAHGMALGFDFKSRQMLKVPYFHPTADGRLDPVMATIGGTDNQAPFTWAAILQHVRYGEDGREKTIGEILWQIEQICDRNDVGTTAQKLVNSLFRLPLYMSTLALVKKTTYKSELEWRTTIAECFGNSSLAMQHAIAQIPEFSFDAQMPLQTVDVRFRPGGRAGFKPYTEIPFEKSALVKVVIGPNVESLDLAVYTARRMLDRYGFRHTEVVPSEHAYRP
jgi:Protein of unknown function (DUF2971)